MSITTYSQLKASIANWLNRDDLTAVIPDFIALAETDINRRVRHWRMEKRSTASIDSRYTELPPEFLEPIRFHLDVNESPLELTGSSELQKSRGKTLDQPGTPQFYAVTGSQLEVWPLPDGTYTGELYYFAKTSPLNDETATNWVLQYHPDVYLYGALTHSAPYLADDQRAAVWASLYQSAIDGINANNEDAKFGGNGLRVRINSY